MSILGLHCGRRMGNSEILLKEALMAVEEITGVEGEIIRLMDLTIKACTGCEYCTKKRSKGEPMECVMKDDHMSFLLDKLLTCDALILSTPVYILAPPGYLKVIADRVFRHAWAPIEPKVGAIICVGGTDWVDLALPLTNLCIPRKIKIIDQQLVTYVARPGQVVLNEEAIASARTLGRRVGEAMGVPIDQARYMGEDEESCPLCHSNLLRLRGNFVECPICDVKGRIEMRDDKLSVVYDREELENFRWGISGTKHHHDEIRRTAQVYEDNKELIKEKMKKYSAYKSCLTPPPLESKQRAIMGLDGLSPVWEKEIAMSQTIIAKRHGPIAEIRLNRPEAYNAFNSEMLQDLADQLTRIASDPSIRGVVLSAEGKAFCAGGDLRWATGFEFGPPAAFHMLAAVFNQGILEIRRMVKPVVAAIHGLAAGGGFSLALACDFRVMGDSAVLRQAYTSNGLCLDGGGTFALPRLVGLARSFEIAGLDEPIDAKKALEWGLVNRVVPAEKTFEEALDLARRIAKGSLNSFGHAKRLLTDSLDTAFEAQLERERVALAQCAASPDGREGMAAFLEKRKPVFYRPD